ncbi:MAG: FecR domain-containing protein, partial [Anaerolineales bacterium]|nr:FecR domain-containing protein [Anaerolineales bacterium]
MTHRDDLQTFLEKLDDGWTMDQLQSQLIDAPAEMQVQVRLAQQLKVSAAAMPSLSAATRQSHQRQLMAAFAAENEARALGWWPRLMAGFSGWQHRPVYLVGGAMAALAAIVIIAALLFNGLGRGNTAVALNEATGLVEIAAIDEATWQPLTSASDLGAGQQIRTGSDGHAVLEFVDGSTITLEADSSLAINTLESDGNQLTEVSLTQQKGVSRHDVMPQNGGYDHYLLNTPAGQISVRGTRFNVNVANNGATHVQVDSGQVEMSGQGRTVPIMLGEATLATVTDGPADANTAFNGSGQISTMNGDNWTIGGLPALVPGTAVGRDQVRLNEQVAVTGRLMDDGTWLVDILQPASLITNEFSLIAQLNDFSETAITVGTHQLGITASSIFNDGTNLGQYVTVQVMAQADGQVNVTAVTPLADGDSL